jgi:hypothetical protein
VTAIPQGQCLVYLYRPDDEKGTEFTVTCNGQEICTIEKLTYIPLFVDAGKVEVSTAVRFKMFSTGLLDKAIAGSTDHFFKAEVGKTYYLECLADQSNGQKLTISNVSEHYGRIRIKACHLLQGM